MSSITIRGDEPIVLKNLINKSRIFFENLTVDILPDLSSLENVRFLEVTQCRFLTSLQSLPPNLRELNCSLNYQLTSLPELPPNLQHLQCDYNRLSSLPELPPNLVNLLCSNNQLSSLPELPSNLEYLICNNNQLTSLPELPPNLVNLICDNNQLTSLPELPPNLKHLKCQNNPITSLVNLPMSLISIRIDVEILDPNSFTILFEFIEAKKMDQQFLNYPPGKILVKTVEKKMDLLNFENVKGIVTKNKPRLTQPFEKTVKDFIAGKSRKIRRSKKKSKRARRVERVENKFNLIQ